MTTVQMNSRIDGALKQQGDRVIASLGLTPSQAVRALWGFIAEHGKLPEQMAEQLHGVAGGASDDAVATRLAALERGRRLCAGLTASRPELACAPYQVLRDAQYADRLAELAEGDAR